MYPIGDGSEHWGRPGSLGKYGMIDWLRSQAAKICSADQTEKQNTEREGPGSGGHQGGLGDIQRSAIEDITGLDRR